MLLDLLFSEHQLQLFREFRSRWNEFEKLDMRDQKQKEKQKVQKRYDNIVKHNITTPPEFGVKERKRRSIYNQKRKPSDQWSE
jgi:Sec-independent protein translocase protein TatA